MGQMLQCKKCGGHYDTSYLSYRDNGYIHAVCPNVYCSEWNDVLIQKFNPREYQNKRNRRLKIADKNYTESIQIDELLE